MEYLELNISLNPRNPWADILVAELAELGYESFVETEDGISAYAPASIGSPESHLEQTSVHNNPDVQVKLLVNSIAHQNWNAVWEADFKPVIVSSELAIIAPFHNIEDFSQPLKIVIQPQMSFGTGHHQTTFLMSEYLMEIEEIQNPILDMGTGTGVLAFLAEKRGGKEIVAVDIEPWSVENTIENAQRNNCKNIEALCGDIDVVPKQKYGLILANINKNILKSHLSSYANLSKSGTNLYLSGFFASDAEEMIAHANNVGFKHLETKELETWAALRFEYNGV